MKAKKYWGWFEINGELVVTKKKYSGDSFPVLCIPLDPASVEEMRRAVIDAAWDNSAIITEEETNQQADGILAALGITAPQRKKPLGTKRTEK